MARLTDQSPGCWGINRKTVNEYVLNLGGSGKDFWELSRLDEESLTSILPEPKAFNKPQAYQDLQDLVPTFQKALKQSGFTCLAIWEDYRKKYPDGYGTRNSKSIFNKRPLFSMPLFTWSRSWERNC